MGISNLRKTDAAIQFQCRAKYYISKDGTPILAQVQKFSDARFRESGWERCDELPATPRERRKDVGDISNIQRATRRSKILAFDFIMCNEDLDLFVTFTYSPQEVESKSDYDECYELLRVWLSNRVQRKGLKYVLVPERTKIGDIHFHAIMNSSSVKLSPAFHPVSGRKLTHHGKQIYNVTDWVHGFTTAEYIADSESDRRAVAKYIFKYMGKQMGQKIGGRYILTGGDLKKPIYAYSDDEREFFNEGEECYNREMLIDEIGLSYTEWGFI